MLIFRPTVQGCSLNYRDLVITKGQYPFPTKENIVPGSDGAGTVEAIGKNVSRFKKGDKVLTLFNQAHVAGPVTTAAMNSGVGGVVDGTLRQYAAFSEEGLALMPANLDFLQASTLSCAGLTAWNALYGLRPVKPGDWVLTQGTGGVALFAVQFAKAAGARVISTTSNKEKADQLKSLGADHVLNYKEDPNWGTAAKKLTGDAGVQYVLEVGGPTTMKQSLEAIGFEGIISIIGFLGGVKSEDQPGFLDCLSKVCTVRGVYVGSRMQLEDMVRAIEANNIKPVVDGKVFQLSETKEAYQVSTSFLVLTFCSVVCKFTNELDSTCGTRSISGSFASESSKFGYIRHQVFRSTNSCQSINPGDNETSMTTHPPWCISSNLYRRLRWATSIRQKATATAMAVSTPAAICSFHTERGSPCCWLGRWSLFSVRTSSAI